MKKSITFALALATVSSAFAAPNFFQDPNSGNNAWGPVGTLSFEDDLIIDSGIWNISSISTFEQFLDADVYTLKLYSGNYSDQGGVLMNTWTSNVSPDFDTTGLTLGPGTYYLSYSATSAVFGGDYYWLNANLNNVNGNEAYVAGLGFSSTWAGESFDMSWEVRGTEVPEPATMAVLGLGVAALARRRRNK